MGGVLRRLRPDDLAAFQAYRAIPELGRYQGWSPMPDSQAMAFLIEMQHAPLFTPGAWVQLGIAEPSGQRLIGDVGLFLSEDKRHVEIGFTVEPAAQGRGVGTAAAREAIDLAFSATPIEQVLGITDSRNAASICLLERVGFRRVQSRHAVFRGEPCLEHVYALPRAGG